MTLRYSVYSRGEFVGNSENMEITLSAAYADLLHRIMSDLKDHFEIIAQHPASMSKYSRTLVKITKSEGFTILTFDIKGEEAGRYRCDTVQELLEKVEAGERPRAYFNAAMEEEFDIRSKKSWVGIDGKEIAFLDSAVGNPISFNKGKGGELIGWSNIASIRNRRFDVKAAQKGRVIPLLKEYITLNNENSRYKEPVLTVR